MYMEILQLQSVLYLEISFLLCIFILIGTSGVTQFLKIFTKVKIARMHPSFNIIKTAFDSLFWTVLVFPISVIILVEKYILFIFWVFLKNSNRNLKFFTFFFLILHLEVFSMWNPNAIKKNSWQNSYRHDNIVYLNNWNYDISKEKLHLLKQWCKMLKYFEALEFFV